MLQCQHTSAETVIPGSSALHAVKIILEWLNFMGPGYSELDVLEFQKLVARQKVIDKKRKKKQSGFARQLLSILSSPVRM